MRMLDFWRLESVFRSTAGAAFVLAALAGCGPAGPELVPVTGVIRLKGSDEPLRDINVTFLPKPGTGGLAASGTADSDGTVVLMTNERKGVKPGDYFVGIIDQTVTLRPMFERPQPGDVLFPRFHHKYNVAESSGLEMTVTREKNSFQFEVDPHPKRQPESGS